MPVFFWEQMMRTILFLVFSLLSLFASPPIAQAGQYEWIGPAQDANGQQVTGTSGIDVCNKTIRTLEFGNRTGSFTEVKYAGGGGWWCLGGGLELSGLFYELMVFKFCSPYGGSGEACAQPTSCPINVGNPTNLVSGAKIEVVADWVSAKEPRFRLARTYLSDDSFSLFSTENGGFAQVWQQEMSVSLITTQNAGGTNLLLYLGSDGSRKYFNSATLAPFNNQSSLRLERSSILNDPTIFGIDNTFTKHFFSPTYAGSSNYFLSKIIWRDGYSITISRNSMSGVINSLRDNRGQAIDFTWSASAIPGSTTSTIASASIDTDFAGTALVPELVVAYNYSTNAGANGELGYVGLPLLTEVTRTVVASQTTQTISKYNYAASASTFPPPLMNVYDGRVDSAGMQFPFATFGYVDTNQATSNTSVSGHTDGNDSYSFARTTNTTTTTNALGKQTTYHFAEIDGIRRVSQVDGVAALNCLGTAQTFDYTPVLGGPLGYVYSQVERNGSRTDFIRNSRGLITQKTEDAAGVAPRITSTVWHPIFSLPVTRVSVGLTETFTYTNEGLLTSRSMTDTKSGSPTLGQVRTWTYAYTTLASGLPAAIVARSSQTPSGNSSKRESRK